MSLTLEQVLTFLGGGLLVFVGEQIISHLRRTRKILSFTVETQTIAEKSHADLKLQYKGIEVERVYLQKITLRNAGNTAIASFPVYIQPPPAKGIFFSITTDKPGIHCDVLIEEGPCAFKCDLLNPGDTVTVDLTLIDAEHVATSVDARSENLVVKEIPKERLLTTALDIIAGNASGLLGLSAKTTSLLLKG